MTLGNLAPRALITKTIGQSLENQKTKLKNEAARADERRLTQQGAGWGHAKIIQVKWGQSNGTQQWESGQPIVLSTTHDTTRKISSHAQGAPPPALGATFTQCALGSQPEGHLHPTLHVCWLSGRLKPSPVHTNQTDPLWLLLCPSITASYFPPLISSSLPEGEGCGHGMRFLYERKPRSGLFTHSSQRFCR